MKARNRWMLTGKICIIMDRKGRVNFDVFTRFYELTERMSKMEATIAPILGKLDTILGRIDDAKRMKKQKKEAMASLITTIEEDEQRE